MHSLNLIFNYFFNFPRDSFSLSLSPPFLFPAPRPYLSLFPSFCRSLPPHPIPSLSLFPSLLLSFAPSLRSPNPVSLYFLYLFLTLPLLALYFHSVFLPLPVLFPPTPFSLYFPLSVPSILKMRFYEDLTLKTFSIKTSTTFLI